VFALLFISSCSFLSSGPSSVVKKLISSAEAGDVKTMASLWGKGAILEQGSEKIRQNAESFVAIEQKAKANGEVMEIKNLRETVQGDRARVFFIYRDKKGKDSVGLGFALLKEDSRWTLYRSLDIGEEDRPFDNSFVEKERPGSSPAAPAQEDTIVAPPPPASSKSSN